MSWFYRFHTAKYWNYTSQWNLLDYPSLVFPTGLKCLPEEDGMEEGYQPRNEKDKYNYDLCEYFCTSLVLFFFFFFFRENGGRYLTDHRIWICSR